MMTILQMMKSGNAIMAMILGLSDFGAFDDKTWHRVQDVLIFLASLAAMAALVRVAGNIISGVVKGGNGRGKEKGGGISEEDIRRILREETRRRAHRTEHPDDPKTPED